MTMKKREYDPFVGSDYNGMDWYYNSFETKVYIPLNMTDHTLFEHYENGYFAATFDEAVNMLHEGIIP